MRRHSYFLLLCLVSPLQAQTRTPLHALIRNVNLVTLDERGLMANAVVLVRGGRIIQVVAAGAALPAADTVIDGGGGYLMPGLIDAHIHHGWGSNLVGFLRYGVTTAFALGARPTELADLPGLRRRIDAGQVLGPHLFATGAILGETPNLTVAQVVPYLDTLELYGLDYVKVYNNIPQPVFDLVVAEAHRRGMAVFGHLPRTFPVAYSVSHGLDAIAHIEEFFFAEFGGPRDSELGGLKPGWRPDLSRVDPILDLVAANRVAIIPNLVALFTFMKLWVDEDQALGGPDAEYLTAGQRDQWRRYNSSHRPNIELRMLREQIKQTMTGLLTYKAQEKGILLLTGSDVGIPGIFPGRSIHQEMRLLVAAGLTIEQALKAATVNGGTAAARFVDQSICIGVLKPGCEADLMLLSANPLADIRNTQMIVGVMTDGRWYLKSELDQLARQPAVD